MRYFFTFLGVMIVWRSFSWLRKDRRLKHRRLKQLPDAGTIGILTVHEGGRHLKPGEIIPVPHEGVLGYLRTCDVVVPVEDVATLHLDFTFVDGKGLYIHPRRGCEARVDGFLITTRREANEHPMQHGSILEVGQAVLQLGVFAGLNVQEARMAAVLPEEDFLEDGPSLPDETGSYAPYQRPADPYARPADPYAQPMHSWPQDDPCGPYSPINHPWQGGDGDAP